jgi:predicted nuclease of predicted toxin-antitoxin system
MKVLLDMNLSPRWRTLLERSKPSVVQLRSDNLDPDVIGQKVISALRQLDSELNAGAVVSVDPQGTRMRLLPLRPKD